MKRVVAAALVLLMLAVCLLGCEKEPDLTGTWKTRLDMTAALNQLVKEQDTRLAQLIVFEDITLELTVTFREDNTYTIAPVEASLKKLEENLKTQITTAVREVMTTLLGEQALELDLESFVLLTGIDLEEMIQKAMETTELDKLTAKLKAEGKYHTLEGKLYLSTVLLSHYVSEGYPYTLEGDTLTVHARPEDENHPFTQVMFPLVLQRQPAPETP